jgi:hypothetical protein
VLLGVEIKGKSSWVLYFPLLTVAIYVLYEVAIRFGPPERGLRIDLILIWPLLVLVLGKTWFRWLYFSNDQQIPVTPSTEHAVTSFLAGIAGFILPFFFVCSLMAVYFGHRALSQSGQDDFKGKRLAGFGMMSGGASLLFAGLILINHFMQSG